MTCTILARCTETGQLGVGVVSSLIAVTGRCAFVRAQVGAVAVQSMADPRLGPAALELLAGGYRPEAVMRAFDRTEESFEYRQVALVNARGDTAVHSGSEAIGGCAAPPRAEGCAALGNRMVDRGVPAAMVSACVRTRGELGDRLLAALRAAVADGGAGPVRAAGLLIAEREPWPLVDLRIDWTEGDPVAELDHLWRLWRPQMHDYLDHALDPAAPRSSATSLSRTLPSTVRPHDRADRLVFACVYLGMALGRWPGLMLDRTGIALVGAIVLILAGAVTGDEVRAAIDVPTLVILFGLMVLSAQFAACGFYAWCSRRLARTPAGPPALLALTVAVAGLLSAVLANDVVVFAMTPMLALGLLRRGLDPRPFLIALTSAANAGSAATIIGNPQNILIGQSGGLDFFAFLAVCGPPAVAALVITYLVVLAVWRGRFTSVDPRVQHGPTEQAAGAGARPGGAGQGADRHRGPARPVRDPLPRTEGVLLVAGALLISRKLSTRRILGLVDWHLLVLFAALFVVTHAFDVTGVPAQLVAALESRGCRSDRPLAARGADHRGLEHHRQRAAGRPAAADPAGADPEPALFPGRGLDPGRQPADRRQPRQHHHRRARPGGRA